MISIQAKPDDFGMTGDNNQIIFNAAFNQSVNSTYINLTTVTASSLATVETLPNNTFLYNVLESNKQSFNMSFAYTVPYACGPELHYL